MEDQVSQLNSCSQKHLAHCQLPTHHSLQRIQLQRLYKAHNFTMVQAFRSNSALKARFVVGVSMVLLLSICVAVCLSWATSPKPHPSELDMEANDANFLLNSLPTMSAPEVKAPAPAPKVKKVTKDAPTSEEAIMQHDIDSLKKNLKVHLEKETSDHIQLNNLETDREKATRVEQSLEAKIASEKLELSALQGHVVAAQTPASPLASAQKVPKKDVAPAAADKKAESAMMKALQSAQLPSQMKSKVSSDMRKVSGVLSADSKQKEALARIEMKIADLQATEARDKASLTQVNGLRAKLRGAAEILKAHEVKIASELSAYQSKQDQLAPIVQRDEVRDNKLKSLVSAISRKSVLRAKAQPVKSSLFQVGPVILTKLAQSVAELSHSSQPTDLTFTSLAADTVDSIKAEISANEASLAKVQNYLKTVDTEERAFKKDLEVTKRQEKPIRAGIKAMADI
jgi:hypothetical protein